MFWLVCEAQLRLCAKHHFSVYYWLVVQTLIKFAMVFFQPQIYFFGVWIDFFKFNLFPLLIRRQYALSISESYEVTKNEIVFKFRKENLIFRFPSGLEKMTDHVFSNWVNFIEKVPVIFFCWNSKSLEQLFVWMEKFEAFFFCSIAFIESFSTFCRLCTSFCNFFIKHSSLEVAGSKPIRSKVLNFY